MALGNLIPLVILLIVVGIAAFIGYSMYVWSNELAERAGRKMEKSNLSFTKEGGLRVGVKDLKDESYMDKTQNVLVNVWNNASLPNYKSRLGWNSTQAGLKKPARPSPSVSPAPARPSASRSSSSISGADSRSRGGRPEYSSSASGLAVPADVGGRKRSSSPVPGSWN